MIAVGRLKGQEDKYSVVTADAGLSRLTGLFGPFSQKELIAFLKEAGLPATEITERIAAADAHPGV